MQLKKDFEIGRNDRCSCDSGKKYKKCCLKKKLETERRQIEARRIIENDSKKERYKGEDKEKEIVQDSIEESESTEISNNETKRD